MPINLQFWEYKLLPRQLEILNNLIENMLLKYPFSDFPILGGSTVVRNLINVPSAANVLQPLVTFITTG